jgi:tRNA A37 threonylcarbamoyltransferase TsaD
MTAAIGHLLQKVRKYIRENWDKKRFGRCRVALGGGVSASRFLREALQDAAVREHWDVYYPEMAYTTDNAAMVGIAGWYRWLKGERGQQIEALATAPYAKSPRHGRMKMNKNNTCADAK